MARAKSACRRCRALLRSTEHELVGVVTQPDKAAGRSQKLTAPPIKVAMAGVPIPILQPDRIKSSEAVEAIREWNADVIVVMAYGQILPRAVLELPRIACLNLHASLLPTASRRRADSGCDRGRRSRNRNHRHVHG